MAKMMETATYLLVFLWPVIDDIAFPNDTDGIFIFPTIIWKPLYVYRGSNVRFVNVISS